MLATLSPNGRTAYSGDGPLDEIKVATVEGIYTLRRESGTDSWAIVDRVHPEWPVGSLLYEPETGLLFAGVHGGGGLWRSADRGTNWVRIGSTVPSHIYSIQCQYIGDRTRLWVGAEPASLFSSDDLGDTWTECETLKSVPEHENWTFPPPPHIGHVKGVAWHDSAPDTLFVLVEQGGLFKTTDAGQTFVELKGYLIGDQQFYRDSHRVLIAPGNPDLVYFATGDGLCRSIDGGNTWTYLLTKESRIGYPDAMFIDALDERKIVIGGPKSAPETWRQSQHAQATVLVSTDGGDTFVEQANGLDAPLKGNIEAMAMASWDGQVAYLAGTATGQLFLSEDGAASWSLLSDQLPPISKAGHYRWFLSESERHAIEARMRGWKEVG
jgi:photosystem II stability/assembly factor-like uncharacterized protein